MKVHIGRYPSDNALRKNPSAAQIRRIHIDKWDTWNMDHTLAEIIVPMLKQLKETAVSFPSNMPASKESSKFSAQYAFDFYEEDEDRISEIALQQWNDILDKMIWSFEQILDEDRDSKFHSGKSDIVWKTLPNGFTEMARGPNDTHRFDAEGYKKYYEKIQEGLDLFGKHYLNLWD